jgi:hypothetical protein
VLIATALALALAAAGVARAVARARGGDRVEEPPPPLLLTWLRSSAAIAGLYILQEGLEGMLAPGHAAGVAGVLGHGGWTAFLFAAAIGAIVAWLLRGAAVAVVRAARRPGRSRGPTEPARPRHPRSVDAARPRPLALHLAGRGPPALLS